MNRFLVLIIAGLFIVTSFVCLAQPADDYRITREELDEFESLFWGDNWRYIYRYRIMGIQTPRLMMFEEYITGEG